VHRSDIVIVYPALPGGNAMLEVNAMHERSFVGAGLVVAGTGHRPDKLGGYSSAVDAKLRGVARAALEQLEVRGVISGMALGWDMALAEAALELGLSFVAAVPFAGQESRWPRASQERHRALLERATAVRVVCADGYAAWKMQRRNEWMVERADVILALWNGSSGGTANCVAYAEGRGSRIVNVWEAFEAA
jgi:uncharacterized phage-like protein YoqJ